MEYTLTEYASRNELNEIIARNMIYVEQLQGGRESFEKKATFCFSKAYHICRNIIECSPVSIYKIPDYYAWASYPYSKDEDQQIIMKAVTISIVTILIEHFDNDWKEENQEFLSTLSGPLWSMRLKSEKKGMLSMDSDLRRMMGFSPICGGIYNSLHSGTNFSFTIPYDEFDPTMPKVLLPEEAIKKIVEEAMRTADQNRLSPYYDEQNKTLYLQGIPAEEINKSSTNNKKLKTPEKLKARIKELELEVQRWKDELDYYKERQGNRSGINQLQTAHLGIKLAPELGINVSNKKDLAPVLHKLFGWGKRKLEQEMCKYIPIEEEMELANIFGELSPELARKICSSWQGTPTEDDEAPQADS